MQLQLALTDAFGCVIFFGTSPDIAPVIEGAVHHIASRRLEFGGAELTKLLALELGKSNPLVKLDMTHVERLKELYSCCAVDDLAYEKMQQTCQEEEHTLPDGQVCTLRSQSISDLSWYVFKYFSVRS